jgi:phosphoribosylformylglycinamidine synthase subunit PurS
MIARVVIVPKPVVNDPQGVTVRQGLNSLGFAEVGDVRVGKYLEVRLDGGSADEARRRVDEMCRRLLANQVIEDYRFEVVQEVAHDDGAPTPTLPQRGEGIGEEGGQA